MECGLRFCLKLKYQDRGLTVGNPDFSSSFLPPVMLNCHRVPGSFYLQFTLEVNLPIKVMDSGKARKARSPNIKHAVKEKKKDSVIWASSGLEASISIQFFTDALYSHNCVGRNAVHLMEWEYHLRGAAFAVMGPAHVLSLPGRSERHKLLLQLLLAACLNPRARSHPLLPYPASFSEALPGDCAVTSNFASANPWQLMSRICLLRK